MAKLWSGRFERDVNAVANDFHSSIAFDCRLYKQDILGSIAHAKMLGKQGILSPADAEAIVAGLQEILADIEAGKVAFDTAAEDIHMNIETLLIERIGEAGKKLHTGRSRNDQVATDMRLYMMEAIRDIQKKITALIGALVKTAEEHLTTVMPGYTHLQKAQPVTLAHHLMAYAEMFKRDWERLSDCYKRTDVLPLGAGALAGTTYPLDREWVAKELGFSEISQNSLDAVSDRDFCVEFLSAASLIMVHLSRFCEELILWSTDEFGLVEMDDSFSTGSSIMPQKKNPDMAELIRGKSGRVFGDLMGLLTMLKGLPLAYNKDMQEDKEAVFDGVDTVGACLAVFTGMFSTLTFHPQRMAKQAAGGFTNATDAADYLAGKKLPFRSAHEVIGKMVLYCIKEGKSLLELTMKEFKSFSPLFEEDVYKVLSIEACVERRSLPGGPAADAVKKTIQITKEWMESLSN